MTAVKTSLFDRWQQDWLSIGGNAEHCLPFWERLSTAYSTSNRHYHTLQHLAECFTWLDAISTALAPPEKQLLSFALWFHDIEYDSTRADNEEVSAEMATAWLQQSQLGSIKLCQVHQMILATKKHRSDDPLTQRLLEIDLSILGADDTRFMEYEHQIRLEYAHIPDIDFAKGRLAVLQQFADRPTIFHLPALAHLNHVAKKNLANSITYWQHQLQTLSK
ncbi:hypothetical protein LIN78_07605 [Leeia sp. TBRC 13508]|uniref:Metal-dependent HD superfamily phosphohydrolase n=1 Tax=Leeia speluncae TaxID=2884804 RepID=A0ABS8D5E0_9NEIS|nr:hypothetical protein [Leeia speluncae]MCB6183409.1 hypothetical protein [Leeia speluncae]